MKPPLQSPPPREEWHFDNVPEPQHWACYYYEFARTHGTIPQDVVGQRSLSPDTRDYRRQAQLRWLWTRFLYDRFQAGRLKFSLTPHLCPEFPETPWQQIPLDLRKTRLREIEQQEKEFYWPIALETLRTGIYDPDTDAFSELNKLEDLMVLHNRPRQFAVVPLDWDHSDAAHHDILNHYLQHRPAARKSKQVKDQHRSPIDSLHALAALRLKRHYGSTSKVMAAIGNGLVTLRYNDDAALRTAIRRAETILAKF